MASRWYVSLAPVSPCPCLGRTIWSEGFLSTRRIASISSPPNALGSALGRKGIQVVRRAHVEVARRDRRARQDRRFQVVAGQHLQPVPGGEDDHLPLR